MKRLNNIHLKCRFITALAGLLLSLCVNSYAQVGTLDLIGPSTVQLNDEVEYKVAFRDGRGNLVSEPFADSYAWSVDYYVTPSSSYGVGLNLESEYSSKIQFTNAGTYIVRYEIWTVEDHPDFFNTWVMATKTITVVDPTKPVVFASKGGIIPAGGTVTLSVSNIYDSYVWYDQNGNPIGGASGSAYTTTQAGVFKVVVTKNGNTYTSQQSTVVNAIDAQNRNYVVSNTIRTPGVSYANIETLPVQSNTKVTQYFDGLGRPVQSVSKQASPAGNDIVQPIEYDKFGREAKKYLPYANGSDGFYKMQAIIDPSSTTSTTEGINYLSGQQYNFYRSGSGIVHDVQPYSETIFERSPLNRPLNNFGPGANWKDSNRDVRYRYLTNIHGSGTNQEKIIAWTLNSSEMPVRNLQSNINAGTGYYNSDSLYVKSIRDEDAIESREYLTKDGKMILKKIQAIKGQAFINNGSHWSQTYYIYDDYGNLRFVLQPELVKKIMQNDSYNPTIADLDHMAFQYLYDERQRIVAKKIPGAAWMYMVYDKRDRLVLTQDGNQRGQNSWAFTKYDALNRPVVTGIYTPLNAISRIDMQATATNNGVQNAIPPSSPPASNAVDVVFPYSEFELLTINYYDNYSGCSFCQDVAYSSYAETWQSSGESSAVNSDIRGQVAGSSIRVLGTSNWLHTKNYYDNKYRLIQSISSNHLGGKDRVSVLYDFTSAVVERLHTPLSYNGKGGKGKVYI